MCEGANLIEEVLLVMSGNWKWDLGTVTRGGETEGVGRKENTPPQCLGVVGWWDLIKASRAGAKRELVSNDSLIIEGEYIG